MTVGRLLAIILVVVIAVFLVKSAVSMAADSWETTVNQRTHLIPPLSIER